MTATPDAAAARPRFTLSAIDWIAMLVVSLGGGVAYNFPAIPDRAELAAASFGTGLALAFMAWLAGRVQWAGSGRVAGGGRVAFRIALVVLAGFAAYKGAERGNAQAQAQAAAAIAQVSDSRQSRTSTPGSSRSTVTGR